MKAWFHKHFPDYSSLLKSGKVLAWLTFLSGVHYAGSLLLLLAMYGLGLAWYSALILVLVAALNLWTAWSLFRKPISGMRWSLIVNLLALIQFRTASGVFFDLSSVLKLSIGPWWSDGSFFRFNFVALAFIIVAAKNIAYLKKQIHAANPDIPENQI